MYQSITHLISSYNVIFYIFIYVILAYTSLTHCSPPPCGLYGAPPCPYLPAPPGQTPICARPGKTYCEHIDSYPTYLIKHLVEKWGYEARNLLIDETWEDFTAVAWFETPVFYDPKSIFPQRNPNDFNGYNYQTPPYLPTSGNVGGGTGASITTATTYTESPTYLLYTSSGERPSYNNKDHYHHRGHLYYNNGGKNTPYNATIWLKRIVRDLSLKKPRTAGGQYLNDDAKEAAEASSSAGAPSTRDVSLNMNLLEIVGVRPTNDTKAKYVRIKRQSPGRTSLCQTTSQFITPQAALNSRGNWMFVVNEPNTARQMVKAELCASNTCSNLCELPNGYNSRCEQKFVQKRLIALQGNGQNLYTDSFWFPSCCVCTIAAN